MRHWIAWRNVSSKRTDLQNPRPKQACQALGVGREALFHQCWMSSVECSTSNTDTTPPKGEIWEGKRGEPGG